MSEPFDGLAARARQLQTCLIDLRRSFHRCPEIANEEFETTRRLRRLLEGAGIEIMPLGLETGLAARVMGPEKGPCVALRADIDGLPLPEETGLEFSSERPGFMHACGHDSHITWLLGAAFLLKEMEARLPGEIRMIFQHAEEGTRGAIDFVEAGVLKGVDMIFGAHNKPDMAPGAVGIRTGFLMAATGGFHLRLAGRGGHGAIPQLTRDPMPAVGALLLNLQSVVARNVDPLEAAVLSVGKVQAGTAANIIPATAEVQGTIRAYEPSVQDLLCRRIREIAEHTTAAYSCDLTIEHLGFRIPPVDNDPVAAEVARRAATALLGPDAVGEATPVMASEDFSLYQRQVPGAFLWVGSGGRPDNPGWHDPTFSIDEECLVPGAALLAACALQAMQELM